MIKFLSQVFSINFGHTRESIKFSYRKLLTANKGSSAGKTMICGP